MFSQYRSVLIAVVVIVAVGSAFFLGVYTGYKNIPAVQKVTGLIHKEDQKPATVDFSPFWRAWNTIDEHYASTNGPDDQQRVWGAISGLVDSLEDPYSVFLPPRENEIFESDISGEFEGVGMEIGIRDGILTVIAPLKNTPAEKAGIKSGDKVLEIDGTTTEDMTAGEAAQIIRGEKGTEVVLTVVREGETEPLTFRITRGTIAIPTIDTEVRSSDGTQIGTTEGTLDKSEVFVLRLYNFSAQSPSLFRQSLRSFVESGKDKLILDLRGNPGGYLEASVDMASWFLPVGKPIVREIVADGEERRVYRSKGYNIFNDQLKMVILVDGGSASASEILAGALREHDVATLVGKETFGKGSVQELVPITEDTSLKITVARWLTPNGISISEGGLTPDEIVEQDEETEYDDQLKRAIEILTEE